MSITNSFTIKDLEALSGIKAHTIRIWEQRYQFLKPQRTDTNIRYYSSQELKLLLNVSLLSRYGYRISKIDKMAVGEIQNKVMQLAVDKAQQEYTVNSMIQYMVDVNVEAFEAELDRSLSLLGLEKTITAVVFSFLEKVGVLWLTDHINPAQEHLTSNIIRQKLILAIEHVKMRPIKSTPILMFLPEGEHHELGLLFMYYVLKSKGYPVLYLGCNIPISDLVFLADLKKPGFLYCHLTSVANNFHLDKYLLKLSKQVPDYEFVFSGQLVQDYQKKIPANVKLKRTYENLMEHIALFP